MWKNVGQEKIHRIEGKSMKDDPNPMDSKKRRGTEKISRNFCVNFEFFLFQDIGEWIVKVPARAFSLVYFVWLVEL